MELKDALLRRRSVRKFTDEPVSEEHIQELLHAAMSGPSACNRQPWAFYVITNPGMVEALQGTTMFTHIKGKIALVVCGDLSRALPGSAAAFWIQDCSAATENILLRVTDLGLGAVWCGIHPKKSAEEKLAKLLNLPEKHIPLNIIFIGHPAEEPEPRDWYDEKCVHIIR